MKTGFKNIGITWLLALLVGCVTPTSESPDGKKQGSVGDDLNVAPVTLIPDSFSRGIDAAPKDANLNVSRNLVEVRKVKRPRAELRVGPGARFPLNDQLLVKGEEVLVIETVDVWKKVVAVNTKSSGWVHNGVLAHHQLVDEYVTLPVAKLPTVIALHEVSKIKTYPDMQEVKVKIPKGAMFRFLKQGRKQTLVWLADTNSVMWVSGKDLK